MSDYISLEAAAKREKIKTPFARIVVNNNPEKNYYNIMWWQDGEMHVGFGSANLNFVRKWLSEEFEVASPPPTWSRCGMGGGCTKKRKVVFTFGVVADAVEV